MSCSLSICPQLELCLLLVPYSASLDPAHSSRGDYLVVKTHIYAAGGIGEGRRRYGGVVGRSRERGGIARRASRESMSRLGHRPSPGAFERARVRLVVMQIALARARTSLSSQRGHPWPHRLFLNLRVADGARLLLLVVPAWPRRRAAISQELLRDRFRRICTSPCRRP